jgi:hypothetical protein
LKLPLPFSQYVWQDCPSLRKKDWKLSSLCVNIHKNKEGATMQQSPSLHAVCKTLYSVDEPGEVSWDTLEESFDIGITTIAMARDQINKCGMVPENRRMEFIAGLMLNEAPMNWTGRVRGRDVGMEIALLARPLGLAMPDTEKAVAVQDRAEFPTNFLATMRPEAVAALVDELLKVFLQPRFVAMSLAAIFLAEASSSKERGLERVKVQAEAHSDPAFPQSIQIELRGRKSLGEYS